MRAVVVSLVLAALIAVGWVPTPPAVIVPGGPDAAVSEDNATETPALPPEPDDEDEREVRVRLRARTD